MSRDIIFSTIDNGSRSLRWTGNCSGVVLNGLTCCWSRIIRCLLFEECEGRVARLEDGDGRFSVDFAIDLTSCGGWMSGEGFLREDFVHIHLRIRDSVGCKLGRTRLNSCVRVIWQERSEFIQFVKIECLRVNCYVCERVILFQGS